MQEQRSKEEAKKILVEMFDKYIDGLPILQLSDGDKKMCIDRARKLIFGRRVEKDVNRDCFFRRERYFPCQEMIQKLMEGKNPDEIAEEYIAYLDSNRSRWIGMKAEFAEILHHTETNDVVEDWEMEIVNALYENPETKKALSDGDENFRVAVERVQFGEWGWNERSVCHIFDDLVHGDLYGVTGIVVNGERIYGKERDELDMDEFISYE